MLSVSYTRRKGQDFFMSIFENTVMIKKRPSYGQLFAQYLLIALTILSALGTILFSPLRTRCSDRAVCGFCLLYARFLRYGV